MEKAIHQLIHVVVLIVWGVVGLALYVPLLIRVILIYSAMMPTVVLSGNRSAMTKMSAYLSTSIAFYPVGFKFINASFNGISSSDSDAAPATMNYGRTMFEMVWSTILYFISFSMMFGLPKWASPSFNTVIISPMEWLWSEKWWVVAGVVCLVLCVAGFDQKKQ